MQISIIQTDLFWQDKRQNLFNLDKKIDNIIKTDLIILPEMFNTGFSPSSVLLAESMNGPTVTWMKERAKTKKCVIAGSLIIVEEKKYYNRLIWVTKNGRISHYDKRHLFSLVKEEEFISRGNERLIVELEGYKICPLICYDLRFPVFSRNNVEYDMLIYVANWPEVRIDAWNTLLKARAIENQCYTVGVNRVGIDGNGIAFNGQSQVFDLFGTKLLGNTENQDMVLQIETSLEDLKAKRDKTNFLKDGDGFLIQ